MSAAVIDLNARRSPALANPVRLPPREPIAAHRASDRAELVATLLLAMEQSPLARPLCYPVRAALGGGDHVVVIVAGQPFRLLPDDCRDAADALVAEQAFPGCVGAAGDLREAAALAEARPPHGGPLTPVEAHGVTGRAVVVVMAVAALVLAVVHALAGRG